MLRFPKFIAKYPHLNIILQRLFPNYFTDLEEVFVHQWLRVYILIQVASCIDKDFK